jgi:hypothetical protein
MLKPKLGTLEQVNKELWILLSLFAICLLMNRVVDGQRMVLSFYTLPTLGSAYLYGRRQATLTALGSGLLVCLMSWYNPSMLVAASDTTLPGARWVDVAVWGGVLIVTGYSMGTLYEHRQAQLEEMRETYHGVLMILRHFIVKDAFTENHSYRVSVYAARIATSLNLSDGRIEDTRAAALLHDIGKLDISRELLYKAARLTNSEYKECSSTSAAASRSSNRSAARCAGSFRSCWRTTTNSTERGTTPMAARRFRSRRASSLSPTCTIR